MTVFDQIISERGGPTQAVRESMREQVRERPGGSAAGGPTAPHPGTGVECQIPLLPQPLIRERLAGLRRETAPLHARLDEQIGAAGWLASQDGYTRLLARFLGYYAPLEPVLRDAVARFDLPLDMEARRKGHLLVRDLLMLGLSPNDVRALPLAPTLPPVESREAALGCLYVLEGATLGGRVIARHAQRTLGLDVETGAAFFSGYGSDVGAYWQRFCSLLADALRSPDAERTIAASAATIFTGIGCWFQEGDTAP
jgi:heme oxygenase